jgi:hypothetical protein
MTALVGCSSASSVPEEQASLPPSPSGPTVLAQGTAKPAPPLVGFRPEPAGAHCAAGGQALLSGADTNGNGLLDSSEITSTSYICNGVDGKTPVVRTTNEPAGTRCPTGGQAISWGYDADKNGTLEPAEVSGTSYVCNGQNGQNGQNGKNSLVTLIDIPAGDARCGASGGKGIYTGLDLSGDGLLQPTEVQASSFVCNGSNGASGAAALIKQTNEPAGANCANAGVRVESGLDTNASGALDAGEITRTSFVCHGMQGPAGPQGPVGPQGPSGAPAIATLLQMTPEAAGVNCSEGGQRIDIGADANGNAVLEAAEVTAARYVCNGANGGGGVLTRVTPVPEQCRGGIRLEYGVDFSGDGELANVGGYVEIQGSALSCLRRVVGSHSCASGFLPYDEVIDRDFDGQISDAETTHLCFDGFVREAVANNYGVISLRLRDGRVRSYNGRWDAGGGGDVGLTNAIALSSGYVHTCALLEDTSVRCWNQSGESDTLGGPPDPNGLATPIGSGARAIGNGHFFSCAVMTNGTVSCWGYGIYPRSQTAIPVPGLTGVAAISGGGSHACVLRTDGTVACWGDDNDTVVEVLSGATSISAGVWHSCASLSDGTARCWGRNESGQLGDGTLTDQPLPVPVLQQSNVTSLVADGQSSCALHTDASVSCWGPYTYGWFTEQAAVGIVLRDFNPYSAMACVVHSDGLQTCLNGPLY